LVNEAIVNDTVKRMLDSGIDQPTIIATLKDIGLSDADANAVIQKMSTPPPSPAVNPDTQATVDEVRQMKEEMVVQGEKQALNEESTHAKLDEHREKIDGINQKVSEVHEAVRKMPLNGAPKIDQKTVTELNLKLDEVSATAKATRDLMQQILEINRRILTELESKK